MTIKMTYVNAKYIIVPPKITYPNRENEQAIQFIQESIEFYLKFQINIITLKYHNVQAPTHTLVKKRKGVTRVKERIYEFEPLDIFIDSQQAELTISIAMLKSLLNRKLLTEQQYNDCVTKIKQLYNY